MTIMKKLVIFDLDGTLLNTIEDLGTATNVALKKCGFSTHPLEAYPYFVGNGIRRLVERALPDGEKSEQNITTVLAEFKEYYNAHSSDLTKPYTGIPELLRRLTECGVKVAVASNKYHQATVNLINTYFPEIDWADIEGQKPDVPLKPDPSVVFEILAKVPTRKADVLYVGDSGVDMETARRACVDSCGVTWGFRPAEELQRNYAGHIVSDPAEIYTLVVSEN